jgi:hypothetical protein
MTTIDDLALDAGRVRQRAEEVEHRRDAQLGTDRRREAHRRVEGAGEAEADAALRDAVRHTWAVELEHDAQGLEQVRRARGRRRPAVPVLHDPGTGAGSDDRRHGGDVEGVEPTRGSPAGTDDVDRIWSLGEHDRSGGAHHGVDQPRDLLDRFSLHAQGDDEGGDLGVGGLAGEDLGHGRTGLLGGEVSSGREPAEDLAPPAQGGEIAGLGPVRQPRCLLVGRVGRDPRAEGAWVRPSGGAGGSYGAAPARSPLPRRRPSP